MGSLLIPFPLVKYHIKTRNFCDVHNSKDGGYFASGYAAWPTVTRNFQFNSTHSYHLRYTTIHRLFSYSNSQRFAEEEDGSVQDLRVPTQWLEPSKALEESEWLRVTLHKWLDDEYCPEETNIEISKIAARSYYRTLVGKETDLGEILLEMVRELDTISYQDSFHGAFSSANAAVNLIIQRIEKE